VEDIQAFEPIFVARQPVFTRKMDLWGHELLFRHCLETNLAEISDPDQATAKVIVDGFALAQTELTLGRRAMVNFPHNLLLEGAAHLLPPDQVVVEVLESVPPDKDVLEACAELKKAGYTLAVDDFTGRMGPRYMSLLKMMDIVKVDMLQTPKDLLPVLTRGLKKMNLKLLAEKVEDQQMFEQAEELGFDLFQGFFFSKPVIVSGRKLSSSKVAKLRILEELGQEDVDLIKLSSILRTDVSLSYRLLRYINSPGVGLITSVESIERAVALLGIQNLRRWLRVTIMSDFDRTGRGSALVSLSAQRGMYLQLLAKSQNSSKEDPDGLFLLGFFSLLEALLEQPMEDVLENLPLVPWVKNALVDQGAPQAKWLRLVEAQERANWPLVGENLKQLGLDPVVSSKLYFKARRWADTVLHVTASE
jgi:EAL and modified HD-GYP domain-containing signal transduction protein